MFAKMDVRPQISKAALLHKGAEYITQLKQDRLLLDEKLKAAKVSEGFILSFFLRFRLPLKTSRFSLGQLRDYK